MLTSAPHLLAVLPLVIGIGCRPSPSASLSPGRESRPSTSSAPPAPRGALFGAVPTPTATQKLTECGDASVEEGETCDDGNTTDGDGCSGSCRREPARFLSQQYVLVADGAVVARKTGQALEGRVVVSAPEGAVLETKRGLRYYYELYAAAPLLPPLPSDAGIAILGVGHAACLLNDRGEVWCLGGGTNSDWPRPQFEPGPQVTESGVLLTWYELRRAPGPVVGLAGDIDFGCILLDSAAIVQCWRKDSLSAKMSLGRRRVAKQIVAGSEHFCVLSESGEVGCWGDSKFGQTGYVAAVAPEKRPGLSWPDLLWPERRNDSPPQTFLKFDSPVRQLAASSVTSCALLENGKLWCWGDTDALAFENVQEPTFIERMASNQFHPRGGRLPKQLGASTLPHSPIKLPSACSVKDFSLASGELCVLCEDGCAKCWGASEPASNVKKAEPPDECLTF